MPEAETLEWENVDPRLALIPFNLNTLQYP